MQSNKQNAAYAIITIAVLLALSAAIFTGCGSNSNGSSVVITPITQTPETVLRTEPTCTGVAGLCVDITGATATQNMAAVNVTIASPPADGLGAAEVTLSWNSAELTFASATAATGITIHADDSATAGQYKVIFTTDSAITANSNLLRIGFTTATTTSGQVPVQFASTTAQFNLTESDLGAIANTAVTFRDAYVYVP